MSDGAGGSPGGADVPDPGAPAADARGTSVPAAGTDPLALLLRVQDLDTSISQLRHRRATLTEARELQAVEAALADLDTRATALTSQREGLLARQAELEERIAAAAGRRQALEERMYADRGSASRDLQAMDDEIRHLTQRRAEIEEMELEVMVEQEPVDAELARLADERSQLEVAAVSLRTAVAAAEAVVGTELATAESSRAVEAARLPGDLRDRYEALRSRLGGVGAARLIGNHCDGCHLELPSAEVDRVRHLPPGEVATCDQCGRILVRAPAPAPETG